MKKIFTSIIKLLSPKIKTLELVNNISKDEGLSSEQTHMLGNLLKLGNIQVRDIMVPRADIVAISMNKNFSETLQLFIDASHSRMPVFNNQLDNITGMIHVKDLLPYWHKNSEFSIIKIKRNVIFASPSMLVNDLLGQMRATRTHLAIIVDEHGGTDGIVTIEDLVEEIEKPFIQVELSLENIDNMLLSGSDAYIRIETPSDGKVYLKKKPNSRYKAFAKSIFKFQ